MAVPLFVLPDSREQEGTESDEGQLPQVLEELKDLQVAPGTRLAKFQLKVKGKELVRKHHCLTEQRPRPTSHNREATPASSVWVGMCEASTLRSLRDLCSGSSVITDHLPLCPQAIQPPNCTGSKMAGP